MIQNQEGARLSVISPDVQQPPEVFGHQVVLCKMPTCARPAPVGFSNLMVSATQNH